MILVGPTAPSQSGGMTIKLESTIGMSPSPTKLELGDGDAANGTNGGGVISASGETGTIGSNGSSASSSTLGRTGRREAPAGGSRRASSEKFTTADPASTAGLPVTIVPARSGDDGCWDGCCPNAFP